MRSPGIDLNATVWRKSSYSDGGPNNCVEVADGDPELVPVRDSKTPNYPVLTFSADSWSGFVSAIKDGAL